jgi:hypothetical protein
VGVARAGASQAASPAATPAARPAAAAAAAAPTRLLDARPYYGGDRIVTQAGGFIYQCTTAFEVTFRSTPETSSAGHCAPAGWAWNQGYYDQKAGVIHSTGRMGTVISSSFERNQVDGLVLKGATWLPYLYTAGTGGAGLAHVVGSRAPVLADKVCSDGSFTGQNCAGVVKTNNTCINVSHGKAVVRVCSIASARSSNGSRMVQSGDSGGPVYQNVTGGVLAEGIISAQSDDQKTVYFTEINNFDSKFSVAVAH